LPRKLVRQIVSLLVASLDVAPPLRKDNAAIYLLIAAFVLGLIMGKFVL
jgi:hypothetical protein